ncbi:electron transport complex subunit RsxG [Marinospirillum sp.]|uniref:electron transport complex subunit RsxG n=1 Tax=Marinospirillum sp. TaxID=2183934 RepID=UPI00384B4A5D
MTLNAIKNRLDYQGALLGLVVLATCAALAFAYQLTREPIRAALENDLLQNFSQVIDDSLYDNDLLTSKAEIERNGKPLTWYQARKEGEVTAVIFPITAVGYAGNIEMLLAIKANGEISGVRVLVHRETPGLGDKIEVSRDPWITGFSGKSLDNPQPENWGVKKDGGEFDQFTGATITPRAIVREIHRSLEFFAANRDTFLEVQDD